MAKLADIIYTAGFFDGEGYIGMHRTGPRRQYWRLRVTVTQKDRTPLLFIGVRFGGRIRTMKSGISRWVITGEDAVDFLTAIRPHVIVKATQIDAVLRRPDPAALDQELRQLKRT